MKGDQLYVIQIKECIEKIVAYSANGQEKFFASTMIQDAIIRQFEIMGGSNEASI